jgi:hypothetical protein
VVLLPASDEDPVARITEPELLPAEVPDETAIFPDTPLEAVPVENCTIPVESPFPVEMAKPLCASFDPLLPDRRATRPPVPVVESPASTETVPPLATESPETNSMFPLISPLPLPKVPKLDEASAENPEANAIAPLFPDS